MYPMEYRSFPGLPALDADPESGRRPFLVPPTSQENVQVRLRFVYL